MEPGEKRNTTEKAMDADRANETIKRDECEMRTWYFKVAVCFVYFYLFLFVASPTGNVVGERTIMRRVEGEPANKNRRLHKRKKKFYDLKL